MPKKSNEMKMATTDQMYAVVVKKYGNGRFLVRGNNGKEMQCVMRPGVRNAGKRPVVGVDAWVLVTSRPWASSPWKEVDLAYVYSSAEVPTLKVLAAEGVQHLTPASYEEVEFEGEVNLENI